MMYVWSSRSDQVAAAGCTKRMDNGVQQPRCRCQGVSVGEFATARDEDVSAVGCDATPRLSIDYGYPQATRYEHCRLSVMVTPWLSILNQIRFSGPGRAMSGRLTFLRFRGLSRTLARSYWR
ncbi:hypothetical protein HYQ46_008565 [Verticillium longisporum]|nr:hypothetical protein HYQ46_008565 [Verticillium longisporum]